MAGLLMVHGGLAPRIVNLFAAIVGRTTGGLAIVMVAERCAEIRTVTFIFRRRHVLIHDG